MNISLTGAPSLQLPSIIRRQPARDMVCIEERGYGGIGNAINAPPIKLVIVI